MRLTSHAPSGAATIPPMRSPTVASVNAAQPSAATKVSAEVSGDEELGAVDGADRPSWLGALDEEVAGDDRPPSAAAGRVEETAGEAERLDDPGRLVVRREAKPAPDQEQADAVR